MQFLNGLTEYFKEVASSLKFQVAAAIIFGTALILVLFGVNDNQRIFLTILFLFPACMFIGTLIERGAAFFKERKKKKLSKLVKKLGQLGKCEFTDRLTELWKDKEYEGLGWQVLVDTHFRSAYLTHPSCFECKTDLLVKNNAKCTGFYLECPDCEKVFDVDDIGEKRQIANASFQGEVRRNPKKYFSFY